MNTLRRLRATFTARFDALINNLENHEAIVSEALREIEAANTRSRVHLKKVIADGKKYRERLQEAEADSNRWEERALQVRDSDKEKALECIKRRNKALELAKQLVERVREHTAVENQLKQDLISLQEKIGALKAKKHLLSTRQSTAEAFSAIEGERGGQIEEISSVLERWEMKVGLYEEGSPGAELPDELSDEFLSREERSSLEKELEELTSVK